MLSLAERLKEGKTLVLDGGMGSMLESKGYYVQQEECHNLVCPQGVLEVHQEYMAAGSQAILTNTLTLNAIYTEKRGGMDLKAANIAGARLAREAAGNKGYVLGDMGPTGEMLQPIGPWEDKQFFDAYCQQAEYLAEGGVDGFIIETMFDLKEAQLALSACRTVSDLPVILSMTFSSLKKGGVTFMGNTALKCAEAAKAGGAAAVGANCSDLRPEELAVIAESMLPVGLPVAIQPNAGKPKLIDGTTLYDLTTAEFVDGMEICLKAGVQIVGGCCGTTARHIQALTERIAEKGY